jgi:hypothetical protein
MALGAGNGHTTTKQALVEVMYRPARATSYSLVIVGKLTNLCQEVVVAGEHPARATRWALPGFSMNAGRRGVRNPCVPPDRP